MVGLQPWICGFRRTSLVALNEAIEVEGCSLLPLFSSPVQSTRRAVVITLVIPGHGPSDQESWNESRSSRVPMFQM